MPQSLQVTDDLGDLLACLPLQAGRLRRWHHAAFTALAASAAWHWVGADAAGLVALSFRAHYRCVSAPLALRLQAGCSLWMTTALVVVGSGIGRCGRQPLICIYADELLPADYVRLRRALRSAARQRRRERLSPLEFAVV